MPIDILLVDDSAVTRGLMTKMLERDDELRVVTTASDGEMAINLAKQFQPSIILLDIEMPNMDGLTALPLILKASPFSKVIMVSGHITHDTDLMLTSSLKGAVDYVVKPTKAEDDVVFFYKDLISKIKAYSQAPIKKVQAVQIPAQQTNNDFALKKANKTRYFSAVAIAISTGGPPTLFSLFDKIGDALNNTPIFITQHMPHSFTAVLADNLSKAANVNCKEGEDGELVKAGVIYIAPGGFHMQVEKIGSDVIIRTNKNPPVNFCRPAADPMFDSLSKVYGDSLLGVVMTGMGQDGANGSQEIVAHGGTVIAQDEQSSAVYGMPRAVAELGICEEILSLDNIAEYLMRRCK